MPANGEQRRDRTPPDVAGSLTISPGLIPTEVGATWLGENGAQGLSVRVRLTNIGTAKVVLVTKGVIAPGGDT